MFTKISTETQKVVYKMCEILIASVIYHWIFPKILLYTRVRVGCSDGKSLGGILCNN